MRQTHVAQPSFNNTDYISLAYRVTHWHSLRED